MSQALATIAIVLGYSACSIFLAANLQASVSSDMRALIATIFTATTAMILAIRLR